MTGIFKLTAALSLLAIVTLLTVVFGFWGFVVGVCIALLISSSVSRRERESLEKKRHEELVASLKQVD